MRLQKLAVICNVCFWLTVAFRFWRYAVSVPKEILNTIVMLGIMAVLTNIVWLVSDLFRVKRNIKNKTADMMFRWFNILSLGTQIFYLLMMQFRY